MTALTCRDSLSPITTNFCLQVSKRNTNLNIYCVNVSGALKNYPLYKKGWGPSPRELAFWNGRQLRNKTQYPVFIGCPPKKILCESFSSSERGTIVKGRVWARKKNARVVWKLSTINEYKESWRLLQSLYRWEINTENARSLNKPLQTTKKMCCKVETQQKGSRGNFLQLRNIS